MDDTVVLDLSKLGKSFGPKRVLEDINVRVRAGERLALAGPNGSGKTTLLRCIVGTVSPTDGTVTVAGYPGGSVEARRVTGGAMALEKAFYQRLSGWRNLMFYASLRARPRTARKRVDALVEELELASFIYERVDRYSSGMAQQLGLARALLGDPTPLILDEPTRSLDADAVGRLWHALDRRDGMSLVIASHRQKDLDRCSLRIDLS